MKGHPSLPDGFILPFFWLGPVPCSSQHWILALSEQFTATKVGHQLSQRGGTPPQGMQEAQLQHAEMDVP